jgi:hypothetical protein
MPYLYRLTSTLRSSWFARRVMLVLMLLAIAIVAILFNMTGGKGRFGVPSRSASIARMRGTFLHRVVLEEVESGGYLGPSFVAQDSWLEEVHMHGDQPSLSKSVSGEQLCVRFDKSLTDVIRDCISTVNGGDKSAVLFADAAGVTVCFYSGPGGLHPAGDIPFPVEGELLFRSRSGRGVKSYRYRIVRQHE